MEEFECKKCGICCNTKQISDLAKFTEVDKDGVCIYWNKESKLCGNYENRPAQCAFYPYVLYVEIPKNEVNIMRVVKDLDMFHFGGFPYRILRRLCPREKNR